MRVGIGSNNPVKIKAVENIFRHYFELVEIVSLDVSSRVSNQPTSDQESILGATNRARAALENNDFGVGLEGNIHKIEDEYYLTGWSAIIDKEGKIGIGSAGYIQLPRKFVDKILNEGKELGLVHDEHVGIENTKQKMGVTHFLTEGFRDRQQNWEISVVNALVPFLHKDLYK